MRTFMSWAVGVVVAVGLLGCGGGDDGGGDAGATDTSTPLQGKEVGKTSQLRGTWLAMNEGDFVGFEFMADDKVLVTPAMAAALTGLNSGTMMTYDVLDGGRLSLIAANGQTQVYGVTISGDQFEIKGQMMFADGDTQRFRKLPSGQTLQAAFEEQQRAEAQRRQERYAALQQFIKQPGLVIVCRTPGPNAPPAIAVSLSDDGNPHRAWHDDKPPHVDQIGANVDLNEDGRNPLIQVTYGQQLDPPPAQSFRGGTTIAFEATGDVANPTAVANVNYGGQPFELELKKDDKLHGEIVGRFEAEKQRIAAMKQPLIDALKDFAILEGMSGSDNQNQPADSARFILVRDATTGNYGGDAVLIRAVNGQASPLPQVSGQVTVLNDKPMLLVNAYNRQYQLELDEAGEKLTGGWFYQNNPNGWGVELDLIEALTSAEKSAKHNAERAVLTSLSASTPFLGMARTPLRFLSQPGPFALALTVGPDGAVSGSASFTQVSCVVEVRGRIVDTLAGPQLELQFGNLIDSDSHHAGNLAQTLVSQRWNYRIADRGESGPIKLTDGANTLTQATEDYSNELRDNLVAALSAGMNVVTTNPAAASGNSMRWQLAYDSSANQVTGSVTSGEMMSGFHPQSTISGELTEQYGFPMLLVQVADPPPARQGAFHRTYSGQIVAYPTDDGWFFVGAYWADTNAMARGYFDWREVEN